MKLGSKEHKAQFCEELIKGYHQNIWLDEMNLLDLAEQKAKKQTELAETEVKLARKEFPSKTEGIRAKEAAEKEIADLDKLIATTHDKIKGWEQDIKDIKNYLKK